MDHTPARPVGALVVDDYNDAAESFSALLTCWGYEAFVAHNGAEALRLAQQHRPNVVLLDIAMPDMDGFEVARRLRRDMKLHHALIVSMSGYVQEEYQREAMASGCDHHLVKPIQPEQLRSLLASCDPAAEYPRPAQ